MKLTKYLKDQWVTALISILFIFVINSILLVFKIDTEIIYAINFSMVFWMIALVFYNYNRKKRFFNELKNNLEVLDKKYLVTEMIKKPSFYEGNLYYDFLYEINKAMNEEVKCYSKNLKDFKEYIEMWIHEVKLPLQSANLMIHNNKSLANKKIIEQLKRIDDDTEQVLYYVRSENAEKDYLIKETNLDKVISNVAMKNKDALLENKIQLVTSKNSMMVLTDSKWLEFIINQIVSNSIKYSKKKFNSVIKISAFKGTDGIVLEVYDNGIGIPKNDISKVFDKTFTGSNGRKVRTSTGMGLYIAKKLCLKLGHQISIDSKEGKYTKVSIIFPDNDYYSVLK